MARKTMNIVDVMAWVELVRKRLLGIRVANIYYVDGQIIIKLKGLSPYILLIEEGKRLHLSRRFNLVKDKLKVTPLVMILRKEVREKKINDIIQINNDRIIAFVFDKRKLIAELLPRGIVSLVDENNVVISASNYIKTKDRTIKRGLKYVPPPSVPFILDVSTEELLTKIRKQKTLVRGLIKELGIPGEVAEEAIFRAGFKKDSGTEEISSTDIETLIEELKKIFNESKEGKGYLVQREDGVFLEADPFKPLRFKELDGVKVVEYDSFDDALDDFFFKKEELSEEVSEKAKLLESLRRAEDIAIKYKQMSETYKKLAEIVAMNYDLLDRIRACVSEAYRRHGWEEILRCPNVTSYDKSKGMYVVSLKEGLSVEIGIKESIDKLIVRLYSKAGEAEAKARRALESINEIRRKLEEEELKERSYKVRELIVHRKRKWFEKYHWIITTNNFLAIGGRNADQNESIVRKYLESQDIFLHADIHGAPAVILKTPKDRKPEIVDIMDAAILTAVYSKGWKEGLGSIPVWWVRGDQVSKNPPSGEYLAKGSFMIYGKKNYLRPIQLKLALGISIDDEGIPIVIVGPEELVKKRSFVYAILVPGEGKVEEVATHIKEKFLEASSNEIKHLILALPLEELKDKIPGRSRILFVRRGELKV